MRAVGAGPVTLLVLLALAGGYLLSRVEDKLRKPALVPESRMQALLGSTCPPSSPSTAAMLKAANREIASWPAEQQPDTRMELPGDFSKPDWCFVRFAPGADLQASIQGAIRESTDGRLRLDVYSAHDLSLLHADKPSFSIAVVKRYKTLYVFDSKTLALAAYPAED